MTIMKPWIGVDLDGTLATSGESSFDPEHIGTPIAPMVEQVKLMLTKYRHVEMRIFTARMSVPEPQRTAVAKLIAAWTLEHLGEALVATNCKDYATLEIWDDIARQVIWNKGEFI